MKKTVLAIIIVVAIVVLYFVQPFGKIEDLKRTIERPEVDAALVEVLKEYITENHQPPEDYIITAFQDHDIIFLGEFWKIQQNLSFLSGLIPLLYKNGITELGVEFVLYRDQAVLDRLLTDTYYNESAAQTLLFNYLVIWGFHEYADVFKSAWEFNQTLKKGEKPFRIVGLSVKQEYHYIQTLADIDDPRILKKVYSNGIPDVFTGEVIKKEFVDTGKKALIFTHIHSAFTKFKYQEYQERLKHLGYEGVKRPGQYVYDLIGDRSMTIYIHAPFPNNTSHSGVSYPVGGAIDAAIDATPEEFIPAGFTIGGSPLGNLAIESKAYTTGYDHLTLADYCDGYIILAPLRDLEAVTPIKDFININNIDAAVYNFFGPKDRDLTVGDLNNFIQEDARGMALILDQFQ